MSSTNPIVDRDIIKITEKSPVKGKAEGTWIRANGTSYNVTVIEKSSLGFLALLKHKILYGLSFQWLSVDTGTHFLLLNKKISEKDSKSSSEEVKKAFKTLQGETFPPILEGEKVLDDEISQIQFATRRSHILKKEGSSIRYVEYKTKTNTFSIKNTQLSESTIGEDIKKTPEYSLVRDELLQEVIQKSLRGPLPNRFKKIGNNFFLFTCMFNTSSNNFLISSKSITAPPSELQLSEQKIEALCLQAVAMKTSSIPVLIGNDTKRLTCTDGWTSFDFSLSDITVQTPKNMTDQKTVDLAAVSSQLKLEKTGKGDLAKSKMQTLLEQAEKTGTASIVVSIDKRVFLATLRKNSDMLFSLDCSLLTSTEQLSNEELEQIDFGNESLQPIAVGSSFPRFVRYCEKTNTLEVTSPKCTDAVVDTLSSNKEFYFSTRAKLSLEAEQSPRKEATLFFSTEKGILYIRCKKQEDGTFSITSEPTTIKHRDFSSEKQKTFASIMKVLQSGKGKDTVSRPALPQLLERATNEGKASLFVAVDKKLYRAIVTLQEDGSFSINYTEPCLTQEDLLQFKLSSDDAKYLRTQGDKVLQRLFKLALETTPPGEKKKITQTLNKTILQLRIKEDGTIRVGVGSFLGEGAFKTAQKITKEGLHAKVYVETVPKGGGVSGQMSFEAEMLLKFAGPNILKLRKYYTRTERKYDPKTGQLMLERQTKLKSEFCNAGTAESLTKSRPKNLQEKIQRLTLFRDAARGLTHIHQYSQDFDSFSQPIKYAHMDFKPANLFLKKEGDRLLGIVGDVAPQPEGETVIATAVFGDWEIRQQITLIYGRYKSNQASDVWALGLTLFEFMYGKKANPFYGNADTKELFEKAQKTVLSRLGNSPEDNLIKEMLELDRSKRPKLTPEFLQRIEGALVELKTQAPKPTSHFWKLKQ